MAIGKSFFGQQIAGDVLWTPEQVTIPFGLVRGWDVGASFEWVYRNNWVGFDRLIAFGEAKGADILYVLAGQTTTTLPALADWRTFVTAAVMRAVDRIKYWEPWNEPVYCKGASVADMLALAREAYQIIKRANPSSIVLTPSFNDLLMDYGYNYARAYFELMAHGSRCADAVAFHSYDPTDRLAVIIGRLRTLTLLPLWNTETASHDLAVTFEANARLGVERCVWNAQTEGCDDYLATEGLGLVYVKTVDRIMAGRITSPSKSWWRRFWDFILRRN
jgi:hypothetical protein